MAVAAAVAVEGEESRGRVGRAARCRVLAAVVVGVVVLTGSGAVGMWVGEVVGGSQAEGLAAGKGRRGPWVGRGGGRGSGPGRRAGIRVGERRGLLIVGEAARLGAVGGAVGLLVAGQAVVRNPLQVGRHGEGVKEKEVELDRKGFR